MATLITVYWRDIPAQVIAKQRRESAKVPLSERFADAIDRAAMRAGLAGSDAYLQEWTRQSRACGDDLQAEAAAAASQLEADYDATRLKELIRNQGHAAK